MEELNLEEFQERIDRTKKNLRFSKCIFNFDLTIRDEFYLFNFSKCIFKGKVDFSSSNFEANAYFGECIFEKSLGLMSCKFKGKARFHKAHFKDSVFLNNTTFTDLADFWSSTFDKNIIFYKTDFLGTTVFSNVTFNSNVLFTYTLIEKLIIFSGTKFNSGLDLSLAILSGKISPFGIKLTDYKSENDTDDGMAYDLMVSNNALIPDKNKRETFRILKNYFLKENNSIDYLNYSKLEHSTYKTQLWKRTRNKHTFFETVQDYIILGLNYISNNHGKSYLRGIAFTMMIGWLFFYFALIATEVYSFGFENFWSSTQNSVKYYFNFIIPTHKVNYMDELNPKNWFYFWDFAGRAFVAFGIYQTIQAFRKYKR